MSPTRQAEETRSRILRTALDLFHACSFKGTSVNQIVETAGITKGALFHHFKGKNELGYAVVDELLAGQINALWVEALQGTDDPVSTIQEILRGVSEEVVEDPDLMRCGCPVNNLSQEMSAVDDLFREKLKAVYDTWIHAIEVGFEAGIAAGTVKQGLSPKAAAASVVALFEGGAGLLKVQLDEAALHALGEGMSTMLEGFRSEGRRGNA